MDRNWFKEYAAFSPVCGVDEAGRGPLAGPVYAAAVILDSETWIEGLDDSKKLSLQKREALFDVICREAVTYGIAEATVAEIEELNILGATYLAMNRAIVQLRPQPALSLIDGNRDAGIITPSRCIIKGDAKCPAIAAASILAKVSRDRVMLELAERHPEYAFEQHKGYPTKLHYARLTTYGASPVHRKSFLKNFYQGSGLR